MDDGPLVELAVSTGRPHWFDAAQGAADHAVVVVPFSTRCGPAVLVVRSYEPGRRVFSHDVEVVVATARELSIVVDLVEAAETERTMSDPLDVLAELSAAPPASDAEYLDCVASRVFARRWADVVFVVTGDSRSCTGTYLTADGLRGEWSTSGHSLIEETAEGPVAVSRVSGLRAAEEEMLSAIDIRSYVVSRVGDDTALGIGSTKEDAYDEAAGESFRAMTAAIRVLRTAGRAESKARVVEGQLDRFGRVHQRLMTAIGHQFRTPLTSITGFTRTLVNPDLADMVGEGESRDFLNMELSNASALDEPIVVVAEAGRLPTDPAAVQAIVANLLDNAIRFGGPPVEVTVRRSGRDLSVSVADHGSGLTEHERQEAVNPWVGSDADEANPSVGLGLSLVSELATRLGGDISLRETPGGGLTVEVRLSTRSGPLGP
ncbi:MAG: sensor histidine kinase [Actinobacteria bacterium ATB1]|nr:sensor histidine kinase [Actinobacteria bacterium ATB1]